MRKTKRVIALLLVATMAVGTIATNSSAKTYKKNITVKVGEKTTAKVKGSKKSYKWTTSNKNVATVKKGVIKGIKAGKATVTAKSKKNTYKFTVKVKSKAVVSSTPAPTVVPMPTATPLPMATPCVHPIELTCEPIYADNYFILSFTDNNDHLEKGVDAVKIDYDVEITANGETKNFKSSSTFNCANEQRYCVTFYCENAKENKSNINYSYTYEFIDKEEKYEKVDNLDVKVEEKTNGYNLIVNKKAGDKVSGQIYFTIYDSNNEIISVNVLGWIEGTYVKNNEVKFYVEKPKYVEIINNEEVVKIKDIARYEISQKNHLYRIVD